MGPDGKGHGRNWTGIYGLKFGWVIRILMVFKIGLYVIAPPGVIEWDVRLCGLDQCQKILKCPLMCASRNFQMLQSRGAWVSLLFCSYSSGAWESHQHWIGAQCVWKITWGQLGGMMEMLERQEQENNNWTGKTETYSPSPQPLIIKLTWREIKQKREKECVSQANGQWSRCRRLRNRFCPTCKDGAARRKAFTRLFLSNGCGHVLYMLTAYTGSKRIERIVTVFATISTITTREKRYQAVKSCWLYLIIFALMPCMYLICVRSIEYPVTSWYWAMIGPNAGSKDRLISLKDFVHRLSCCQTVLVGYCLNLNQEYRQNCKSLWSLLHLQWDTKMMWENVKRFLLFSLHLFYWDDSEVAL